MRFRFFFLFLVSWGMVGLFGFIAWANARGIAGADAVSPLERGIQLTLSSEMAFVLVVFGLVFLVQALKD